MNFLTLVVVNHFSCGRPASPISRFGQRIDDVDLELVPATLHGAGNLNAEPTSKDRPQGTDRGTLAQSNLVEGAEDGQVPLASQSQFNGSDLLGVACVRLAMLRLRTCEPS